MAKQQTTKPVKAVKAVKPPLSPAALDTPPDGLPPEVSGVSPPAGSLPEIIVGSEAELATDETPVDPFADHPAIVAAQSFQTPHGRPDNAMPKYYTPPPHELRKKATS